MQTSKKISRNLFRFLTNNKSRHITEFHPINSSYSIARRLPQLLVAKTVHHRCSTQCWQSNHDRETRGEGLSSRTFNVAVQSVVWICVWCPSVFVVVFFCSTCQFSPHVFVITSALHEMDTRLLILMMMTVLLLMMIVRRMSSSSTLKDIPSWKRPRLLVWGVLRCSSWRQRLQRRWTWRIWWWCWCW